MWCRWSTIIPNFITLCCAITAEWNLRCMVEKRTIMIRKSRVLGTSLMRTMDVALLYLRLFTGGVVLLHNVGKMQTYNEIIEGYPPLLFDSPTLTFGAFTVAEVAFAMMIMCGLWVRFAAFMMALGMFLSIFVATLNEQLNPINPFVISDKAGI